MQDFTHFGLQGLIPGICGAEKGSTDWIKVGRVTQLLLWDFPYGYKTNVKVFVILPSNVYVII